MSLLTIGQTLWDCNEEQLREMIETILLILKNSGKIKSYMRESQIQELTLGDMISQIRSRWAHKIDHQMEEYLEAFDSKSKVIGVNVEGWGWVYYIQDKDGHWNFIYDKHHHLCREYAINDFIAWVEEYGTEFVHTLNEEMGVLIEEESPFESMPLISTIVSFERKGDLMEAVIELEEDQ